MKINNYSLQYMFHDECKELSKKKTIFFLLANLNIKKEKEKKIIKHICAIHNTITALQARTFKN
jgi:hypothetical protein